LQSSIHRFASDFSVRLHYHTTPHHTTGKGGSSAKAGGGSEEKEKKPKAEKKAKAKPKGGSDVVVLTDANFDKEVMQSADHWLVEFYAPW
jgi:hypothetical protein